jgi:hypothetical protein
MPVVDQQVALVLRLHLVVDHPRVGLDGSSERLRDVEDRAPEKVNYISA